MDKLEQLLYLNDYLIKEMPEYANHGYNNTISEQKILLRSLLNIRPPMPISEDFIKIQNEFLQSEVEKVYVKQPLKPQIYLWKGDITKLCVDAIVNAGNNKLIGCFIPCHKCIDNAIHSFAGVELRQECNEIMQKQGFDEPIGQAKITSAYNLPSKYIIHTVGPIISGELTKNDCELLAKCYQSCLKLAIEKNLKSIAFCCISTGEYCFPNQPAGEIAVNTVNKILKETNSEIEVIFNVFKDIDYEIYRRLLK